MHGWLDFWCLWVSTAFLKVYLEGVGGKAILPDEQADLRLLLDIYLMEKAIYELGYELNNRPAWVKIPLQGIRRQLAMLDLLVGSPARGNDEEPC